VPEVLKIGLIAPFDGRYRAIGYDAIYAARLAIREINESERIPGYRLALVAFDDRADPTLAEASAEALVIDASVVAVIGHYRQQTTDVGGAVYREAGLPVLAIGGWLTPTDPGIWHLAPPPAILADAILQEISGTGFHSVALFGEGSMRSALELSSDERSFSLERDISGRRRPETDAVISLLDPYETAEALLSWHAYGWRGTLVGTTDLGYAAFREIAGDAATGTRFLTPYPRPQDLQGTEAWIESYRNLGPHVPEPSYYALPTYEAVYTVADAITAALERGPSPERSGIQATLADVSRAGWLGSFRWDQDGYWDDMPLYRYRWESHGPEQLDGALSNP
jgi:ABC-type branched-subunit amino acid transport system substrate-binding protein